MSVEATRVLVTGIVVGPGVVVDVDVDVRVVVGFVLVVVGRATVIRWESCVGCKES